MLASYKTTGVSIRGFTLIGDKDTNTSSSGEWGFGIDFRDVTDASVEDVTSHKMWGDSFYVGVTDTAGTGSNRVTYRNIVGIDSRRQGLSITGGNNITVDGYRFLGIRGTAPMSGIDIEPNTTDLANNIHLLNGYVEDCNRSIIAYKCINLIISNLQVENCTVLFPSLMDRVYDCTMNGLILRGGSTTNYGILLQDTKALGNIKVNNFYIGTASLYPFYINDVTTAVSDIVFSNGTIDWKEYEVQTAYMSLINPGSVRFENVNFDVPAGFDGTDLVQLSPANYIINSIGGGEFTNCVFRNKSALLASQLIIKLATNGNIGNRFEKTTVIKDALALSSSWVAATGFEAPYYVKASNGDVSLYGVISSGTGTDGTIIATLPVGYRPEVKTMCSVADRDGAATIGIASVFVNTNGTITVDGTLENNRAGLYSIQFKAHTP